MGKMHTLSSLPKQSLPRVNGPSLQGDPTTVKVTTFTVVGTP